MNVERTMEFILNCQAKAEVEMAAIRAQQAKAAGEMAAIRKLIRAGMKIIVKQGEHLDELDQAEVVEECRRLQLDPDQRLDPLGLVPDVDARHLVHPSTRCEICPQRTTHLRGKR